MQKQYADKPVRILLAPCNQFLNQEPDPDQQIKKFAEQYVDLQAGNLIMLAKLSLNSAPCGYTGEDACSPASAGCCPANDKVYETLLDYPLVCTHCNNPTTRSHPIGWNFNKILLDRDGRPFTDQILGGGDDNLSPWIDKMLSHGSDVSKVDKQLLVAAATPSVMALAVPFALVAVVVGMAGFAFKSFQRSSRASDDVYLRVV